VKFTVNSRVALLKELNFVSAATEQRQTIPMLTYLLLEAGGGKVRLTGTDLDVTARSEVAAAVDTPGAFCPRASCMKSCGR
jgi:DNA polymerase III subunit beta